MKEVKAKVKIDKRILIHNDLDQAAHYFKTRVEQRVAKDDRDGIGYDMMACLTLLAFAVEAKFNFLGHQLISDWKERQPALDKVKLVLRHLGLDDSLKDKPYKAIAELKEFRDALAHAKPEEIKFEDEIIATVEELAQQGSLSAEYEKFLQEKLVTEAYENVETIWKDLLERSGLSITDTITQGGIQYTILEEEQSA